MFVSKALRPSLLARASRVAQPTQARAFSGMWSHVEMGPKDPILGVTEAFNADPFEGKISVGVGAYRDDKGKPWVLPSVAEAEKRVLTTQNHEYPPITGVPAFVKAATNLAYGAESDAVVNGRVVSCQSLSGTGALRLAAGFISQFAAPGPSKPSIMLPNPTWGNHVPIFEHAGLETRQYRYYDPKTCGLDLDGLLADIRNESKQVILLHACAHNPTGVDPTLDQWKEISQACKDAGHFVIFDNAYQGFASGDTEKDVAAVRMFVDEGHNIALCQSFAKNFGLYGQRIGNFTILCEDADEQARVDSRVKQVARAMYSNPPLHGARIVATILEDPELKSMWQGEIREMSGRIINMRNALKQAIIDAGSTKNWDHITNQIGMFCFTGLSPEQVAKLTAEHHVYLTKDGRISVAGISSKNVDYLANAIHEVTN